MELDSYFFIVLSTQVLEPKGLADRSTIQGFEPHPRFGYGTRIHIHKWVVRDSNPRPGD